ncbi:glycosyltransferase [Oleiagrimonas soli]|uniref:GT2 family glycosyltransferase n=1 Tax=Oleiagrimonas soli TaxID=1543381 RepID=A0A841KJV0_9GAMM|nr:glycosyltransferase [Oleiagrimonas soli]MBB6184069.1 GT2 family glycosyltransferase [Oleiagrimonas soli]
MLSWRLRRLRNTLQRLRLSLGQRGWRGTMARIAQEFRPRPVLDERLPIEPIDVPFAPFSLPTATEAPQVSVIIPVHGKRAYTVACLRAMARHGAAASFEVIVVDDASPDDTSTVLAQIDGLRVITHASNQGFVGSCNDGAAAARGDHLLFLNNDTQVTPGWLDALLACMREERDCGIVGSRLVYPDGRLQEAGGVVFDDGHGHNLGRFESRDDPRFRFRREVDYVSGASLLIPRALFAQVGGFAQVYAPAYYEDTDLAFAVRAAGKRVLYEPSSLVVHFEGITAGTDPERGIKRHQIVNRERFVERHRAALRSHPSAQAPIETALHRYARGRILVIDAMTPEPARDSGSLRLTALFELLHEMGWQVLFAPDDGRATPAQIDALGTLGVQVLCQPAVRRVPDWLQRHGDALDAVMLCRAGTAATYLPLVRRAAPRARVLFDTVDLHFLREARAAAVVGQTGLQRQAEASRRRELALIASSDVTFVVSPVERDLLNEAAPAARVELLSNIHALHGRRAGFAARKDLVFLGGFGHPPNADAVRWFVRDILPRLQRHVPPLHLHVLGDVSDEARRELTGPQVTLHGRVDDLAPFMDGCRVSVAPLRFGAGVKGKVNMAMSYGLPVVATPIAAEGMQLTDGLDVRIGEDAQAFADALLDLYDDEAQWLRLSDGGLDNVRRHFSPEAAAKTLHRVLDDAATAAHAKTVA